MILARKKMTISHAAGTLLILLMATLPGVSLSQSAADYMPGTYPAESRFSQTITDPDDQSQDDGLDVIIRLLSLDEQSPDYIRYDLDRREEGSDPFPYNFNAHGDTLYTSLDGLVDLSVFDGFDLDADLDARLDIIRLSAGIGEEWLMTGQEITLPVPDEIKNLMPPATELSDSMDVTLSVSNQRHDNEELELPYGLLEVVTFRPSLSLEIAFGIRVLGRERTETFDLLDDYGITLQFAPGYGLVREKSEAETITLGNNLLDLELELAQIEGREIVLKSFDGSRDTSADAVRQEAEADKPGKITLKANYPNPFNAATTLSFELFEPGSVDVRIYDQQGRLVDVPVSGRSMSAGTHAIRYQADNLSSGAYIYRIQFTAERESRTVSQGGQFMLIK